MHGLPRIEALAEHLETRNTLLVLDNCEHLIEACADLADALLHACPGVRVLATSREILGIPGEASWSVPPLSLPETPDLPVEQLQHYEAIRLFVERAMASSSSFGLTDQNASAVARLCRRLEGMPLAIELAAARTRVLSAGQIADRLDESLRLLKSDVRTSSPRQQSLRATMDWSFGLLSEEEKVLFGRLSVFVDGFTLAAAEEVCGGDGVDQDDVANILFRLVDKSLVVVDRREEGVQTRFRLLETIWEYASERLEEGVEADLVRYGHAAYFLRLAERAAPELFGPDQASWLGSLETEHDNLRAALGRTLGEGGEAQSGLRLADALGEFWYMHGHLDEGRRWLARGLDRGKAIPPSLRARALEKAGWIAIFQDDREAIALLEESLNLFRELGDVQGSALALAGLGWALLYLRGDEARLRVLCKEAEGMRREPLDRWSFHTCLPTLPLQRWSRNLMTARSPSPKRAWPSRGSSATRWVWPSARILWVWPLRTRRPRARLGAVR
jgi:non-specific serine/threonine protein kinase